MSDFEGNDDTLGDAGDDPVASEQQGKGYGEDEGEREESLPGDE